MYFCGASPNCLNIPFRNCRLVDQLPKSHQSLLRHLVCILHTIIQEQEGKESHMDAYNLAVCVAQSLLWPSASAAGLSAQAEAVPRVTAIFQFLLERRVQIFGEDYLSLYGNLKSQAKPRQDSGTDSDSMHSLLSMQENAGQ